MKVIFYGNFGGPNWGNESALLAMVSRVRELAPEAKLRCICAAPDTTKARFGLDSVPFATNATKLWRPDLALPSRIVMAVRRLAAELGQYASAFRILRDTDMLIVPGTGLITDVAGLHAWGPYSLFKWVLMARARRTNVLLVGVGAGPIDSAAGRILVRSILFLATYTSYRDEESLEYVKSLGLRPKQNLVYPDLVFSLPKSTLPAAGTVASSRRVVGLGLMLYSGAYGDGDEITYAAYLDALATFAQWLLERDYDIRLLLGDGDTEAIEDFRSVLRSRLGDDSERVLYEAFGSVDDLLNAIAATDVVVATRFHNVVMALSENKPVIAISFHHKSSALMRQMGLTEYCADINQIDAAWLIEQFQGLERNSDAIQRTIAQGVEQARAALDEQYDRLFAAVTQTAPRDKRRRR